MELLFNDIIFNLLVISIFVSVINMILVQRFKELSFVKSKDQIFVLNLIFSFVLGISFSMIFYKLEIYYSVWVSIFSFIGASNIYEALKKQTIIKYTPYSLSMKNENTKNEKKKEQ